MRTCVGARVRSCLRASVCACVRVRVRVSECVFAFFFFFFVIKYIYRNKINKINSGSR